MLPEGSIGAALLAEETSVYKTQSLLEGDYLFHRDDPVEQLYVITEGRCRLERTTYDGRTLLLADFGPQQIIADGSLFHQRYGCNCRATTATTLAVFSTAHILGLLNQRPGLAEKWLASLAHQVMDLRTRLELRNVKSARDRILLFLELNADTQGRYQLKGALKSLAEILGLSPESLYRTLAALENEGRLRRRADMIEIIGPQP